MEGLDRRHCRIVVIPRDRGQIAQLLQAVLHLHHLVAAISGAQGGILRFLGRSRHRRTAVELRERLVAGNAVHRSNFVADLEGTNRILRRVAINAITRSVVITQLVERGLHGAHRRTGIARTQRHILVAVHRVGGIKRRQRRVTGDAVHRGNAHLGLEGLDRRRCAGAIVAIHRAGIIPLLLERLLKLAHRRPRIARTNRLIFGGRGGGRSIQRTLCCCTGLAIHAQPLCRLESRHSRSRRAAELAIHAAGIVALVLQRLLELTHRRPRIAFGEGGVTVHRHRHGRCGHRAGRNRRVGVEAVERGRTGLAVCLDAVSRLEGNHRRLGGAAEGAIRRTRQVAQGFQALLHGANRVALVAFLQGCADGGHRLAGLHSGGRIQRFEGGRPCHAIGIERFIFGLEGFNGVFRRAFIAAIRRTGHPAQLNQACLKRAHTRTGRSALQIIVRGKIRRSGRLRLGRGRIARCRCGRRLDGVGAVELAERLFANLAVHIQVVAILEGTNRCFRRIAEIAIHAAAVIAQLLQSALHGFDFIPRRAFFERTGCGRCGRSGRLAGGRSTGGGRRGDAASGKNTSRAAVVSRIKIIGRLRRVFLIRIHRWRWRGRRCLGNHLRINHAGLRQIA